MTDIAKSLETVKELLIFGAQLDGEVGEFFTNSLPWILGIAILFIALYLIFKFPPFSTLLKHIELDSTKEPKEAPVIRILPKAIQRALYIASILGILTSIFVYAAGCFATAFAVIFGIFGDITSNKFQFITGNIIAFIVFAKFIQLQGRYINQIALLFEKTRGN